MTKVSRDDVLRLASLSNLQLNDDEIPRLQQNITEILDYVEHLNAVDTQGVEPTYQLTELENVWRKDEVDDYGIQPEELLRLAPESHANQVKVPKVL